MATVSLWFGPLALFVLGLWWVFRTVRRQQVGAEAGLSAEQRERADRLLDEDRP